MNDRQTGFTLLELMVALAIFALAALAVSYNNEMWLSALAHSDRQALAIVAASNALEEVRARPRLRPGQFQVDATLRQHTFTTVVDVTATTVDHYLSVVVTTYGGMTIDRQQALFSIESGVYVQAQ